MYRIVYFNTGNGYEASSGEMYEGPEEAAAVAALVTAARDDTDVRRKITQARNLEDGTDYFFEDGVLGVKLEYVPEDA